MTVKCFSELSSQVFSVPSGISYRDNTADIHGNISEPKVIHLYSRYAKPELINSLNLDTLGKVVQKHLKASLLSSLGL